ncbi:MAG: response regulator transcription factor [Pseudomonas marincola]
MKIILADDHPLYRMALSGLLKQLDDTVDVIDCCDFVQLQDQINAAEVLPDLVLLDIYMPGMIFEKALKILKNDFPTVPVIVISASEDTANMVASLNLGAEGYIPKSSTREVLLSAIRLVLSGGKYIPAEVFNLTNSQLEFKKSVTPTPSATKENDKAAGLTVRQRNVLDLMAEGKSNKEIAAALELAESTVKVHITAIFRTLGVNNRTQAVLKVKEFA